MPPIIMLVNGGGRMWRKNVQSLKKKELLEIERSNVPLITLSFNPEAGIVNMFLDFDFYRSSKLWIQNWTVATYLFSSGSSLQLFLSLFLPKFAKAIKSKKMLSSLSAWCHQSNDFLLWRLTFYLQEFTELGFIFNCKIKSETLLTIIHLII